MGNTMEDEDAMIAMALRHARDKCAMDAMGWTWTRTGEGGEEGGGAAEQGKQRAPRARQHMQWGRETEESGLPGEWSLEQ